MRISTVSDESMSATADNIYSIEQSGLLEFVGTLRRKHARLMCIGNDRRLEMAAWEDILMSQLDGPKTVGLCLGADFSRVHGLFQQECLLPAVLAAAGSAWERSKS